MKTTNPNERIPGITCPRCGNFIPTSITELISSGSLRCPVCHLRLDIDKQKSDRALKALAKVDEAQKRVNERSRFNG